MTLLIGLIGLFLIGYLFLNLFWSDKNKFETFALSFLIGISYFTLLMFSFNLIGLAFSSINIIILIGSSVSILYLINYFCRKRISGRFFIDLLIEFKSGILMMNAFEKVVFALISLFLVASFVSDLYWPVKDWDALTLYDFRGKAFAISGFMDKVFALHVYYLGYPLFTSLSHAFVYLLGGSNPSFLYNIYYVLFSIILYVNIRRFLIKPLSLIFIFIFVSTNQIFSHSMIAYTNLPYTVFLVIGFIYVQRWLTNINSNRYLIISGLFLGISSWIRYDDPFWIISPIVVLLFLLIFKYKKYLAFFVYTTFIYLMRLPWYFYKAHELQKTVISDVSAVAYVDALDNFKRYFIVRTWEIFVFIWNNLFLPYDMLFIVLALSITLVVMNRVANKSVLVMLSIIVLCVALIFAGTYFTSFTYTKWNLVGNSLQRMSMVFVPLILYFSANVLSEVYPFLNKTTEGNKI